MDGPIMGRLVNGKRPAVRSRPRVSALRWEGRKNEEFQLSPADHSPPAPSFSSPGIWIFS